MGAAIYVTPVFVAILAPLILRDPIGWKGWAGACVGFVGVLLLLRPGTDAFSPWLFLPLGGAVFYALGHISTRSKCQNIPPWSMALALNVVMLCAGLGVSAAISFTAPEQLAAINPYLFGNWGVLDRFDWGILMLLAMITVAVGMLMAGAYQAAPPATIATFEYSYLVFAALWDLLFFGAVLTPISIVGMTLIVCAGILVSWKKRFIRNEGAGILMRGARGAHASAADRAARPNADADNGQKAL